MILRNLIKNCGGVYAVAQHLGTSHQSIYKWCKRGHLPFSDLKGDTDYASVLAELQPADASPRLTADEIRYIGLNTAPAQRAAQ